ncbi:hypothetical protein GCM10009827_117010 [Dactylosporangium maewongense]|uniref:DUF6884 domain-containing protein n=1 Tax=Dactylosporangium maewongense TaxID=634393 RepID=A0ABN2DDZ3_9ACTN
MCRPHAAAYRNGTVNRHGSVTPGWQPRTPLAMPTETCMDVPLPTGPGTVAPGQRVRCMPGSLPARDGGQGGGILRSIGPKTSVVDVDGGGPRRIRNELLHPSAGPTVAAWRHGRGYRTTFPDGRSWLPGWAWLGWTVAEHQQYAAGQRRLPEPAPAPQRLIIVVCGARKVDRIEAPAGELYVGSYHRAARRAADAIRTPGTRVMILSAWYGLVELSDMLLRYDARLGQRHTITAEALREQAEQLGLLDVTDVVVLAPAPYARLARFVWPNATCPLDGTRGIGEQLRRFATLASAATTIAPDPQAKARPTRWDHSVAGERHVIGAQGGHAHLDLARHAPPRTPTPACRARRRQTDWVTTQEPLNCPRCAVIQARRQDLRRWCAMVERLAAAAHQPLLAEAPARPAPIDSVRPGAQRPDQVRDGGEGSRRSPAGRAVRAARAALSFRFQVVIRSRRGGPGRRTRGDPLDELHLSAGPKTATAGGARTAAARGQTRRPGPPPGQMLLPVAGPLTVRRHHHCAPPGP